MGMLEHHDVPLPATVLHQFMQRDTSLERPGGEGMTHVMPALRPQACPRNSTLEGKSLNCTVQMPQSTTAHTMADGGCSAVKEP
jgi:hypothetical protein